jgi:hypothetical protein
VGSKGDHLPSKINKGHIRKINKPTKLTSNHTKKGFANSVKIAETSLALITLKPFPILTSPTSKNNLNKPKSNTNDRSRHLNRHLNKHSNNKL